MSPPSQLVERDLLSASVIVGLLCLKAFRDVPSPPVQAPQQSFAKTIPASSPANPPIPPCPQSVSNHRILCCSVPLHFPAHCWLPLHWKPLFSLPAGKVVCPMKPHSFTYSRNPFNYPPDKTLYFLLCTRSDPCSSFYFSTVFGDHEITGLGTHGCSAPIGCGPKPEIEFPGLSLHVSWAEVRLNRQRQTIARPGKDIFTNSRM